MEDVVEEALKEIIVITLSRLFLYYLKRIEEIVRGLAS